MLLSEAQGRVSRLDATVRALGLCLLLSLACFSAPGRAQTPETEVWLVTYGPGEIYWQRFGHNAIWIRDEGLGLDHVFNFGFFDFEQKGFLRHFVQGRLLYFSAAQPAQSEFAQYINENRSIRAQRLALTSEQALELADDLVREVQPENRDYLYDYYLNNCSTRVRDALDVALGGALRERFAASPAKMNWRDHTRRLTVPDYWLYLGLELGLGSKVDRPVSRWDEFFIPAELAQGVAEIRFEQAGSAALLVAEDVALFSSTAPEPPQETASWWPRYLLIAGLILAAAAVLVRLVPGVSALALARVWLFLAGIVGAALISLWFFTDHEAARQNWNLALFNPLWLLGAVSRRLAVPVGWLIVGVAGLSVLAPLFPPHQYTADVLAAFLLVNVAAAWVLLRAGPGR